MLLEFQHDVPNLKLASEYMETQSQNVKNC